MIGLLSAAMCPPGCRISTRMNADSSALVRHSTVPDPATGNDARRTAPLPVWKLTMPDGTPCTTTRTTAGSSLIFRLSPIPARYRQSTTWPG